MFAATLLVAACGGTGPATVADTNNSYGSAFESPTPTTAADPTDDAGAGTGAGAQSAVRPPTRVGGASPTAVQYDTPKPFPSLGFLSVHMVKDQIPYSTASSPEPYRQTVSIVTEDHAALTIVVTYSDGKTTYGGTTQGTASAGQFVDSWKIDLLTPQGKATVVVRAMGSQTATWTGVFTVTEPPPHTST